MQLANKFRLSLIMLALVSAVMATPLAAPDQPATYIVSHDEMLHWLKTTDAELTYVGAPINPLAPRDAQNTMVTYCTKRNDNVCGGSCSVYNGGPTCIDAAGTSCLSATNNIGFCDRDGCGGSCNQLSTCGTHLDNNFCATPGTLSILVSA